MQYKIKLFVGSLILLFLVGCNKKGNVVISGKLKIASETNVWVGEMGRERILPIDSLVTNSKGEFKIDIQLEHPSLYYLSVGDRPIYLALKPKEDVFIEVDNSLKNAPYYVEGSIDSRLIQELTTKQERTLDKITDISIEYENSKKNPDSFLQKKAELDSAYNNLLQQHKSYTTHLIYDNPKSLVGIFALYQNFGKKNQPLFDILENYEIFNFVDSNLCLQYPYTPAVQALNKEVVEAKKQLKHKKYSDRLTEPGRKSPDFEINTIEGNKIALIELEGSPVVYFFFATWNKISVEEAKKLNEIFKQFRNTGLKVMGVSFDTEKSKLEEFIKTFGIVFPVACDYKYWDSEYVQQFGVRKIPDILLLDPNHYIAQKNINTSELKAVLKEWRKNRTN